jgi:hypothetical protein
MLRNKLELEAIGAASAAASPTKAASATGPVKISLVIGVGLRGNSAELTSTATAV